MERFNEIFDDRSLFKLEEGRDYPSQDEVDFLYEWTEATNNLTTGRISGSPIKQAFEQSDMMRMKVWDYAFGDRSPWTVDRRKGPIWDNNKASKLGL